MKIKLMSQEQYNELLEIQRDFPKLIFQNEGFQYINRREFSESGLKADRQVKRC